MTGTPPNCRCPDNTVWNARSRQCVPETTRRSACGNGMIGTPPNCRCPPNSFWNSRVRRCVPRPSRDDDD
jgi:hypothetical protein